MMCTETIVQFAIPRVVVGERQKFEGNCDFHAERGVEVVLLNDPGCIDLMKHFIQEKLDLWNEDITE